MFVTFIKDIDKIPWFSLVDFPAYDIKIRENTLVRSCWFFSM